MFHILSFQQIRGLLHRWQTRTYQLRLMPEGGVITATDKTTAATITTAVRIFTIRTYHFRKQPHKEIAQTRYIAQMFDIAQRMHKPPAISMANMLSGKGELNESVIAGRTFGCDGISGVRRQ
ncbi:hypothetical protein ACWKX9_05680 [Enterobacter asburiae]